MRYTMYVLCLLQNKIRLSRSNPGRDYMGSSQGWKPLYVLRPRPIPARHPSPSPGDRACVGSDHADEQPSTWGNDVPSIDPYLKYLSAAPSSRVPTSIPMLFFSSRLLSLPSTTSSFSATLIRGNRKIKGIAIFGAVSPPATVSLSWKARYSGAIADMETVDTRARLSELRKLMKERKLDIYSEASVLTAVWHWLTFVPL